MGYSRGWGVRTTLSPFRTLLSPQHSHISGAPKVFHCPGSLHQSLPPWYKQWEGYGPQIRNRIQGIFRKQSSAFFKFFFFYVLQKREKERGTTAWLWTVWRAQQPQPFAPSENVFPWSALHASAQVLAEGWTLVSRDVLMKLGLYIAWSQTPCPIQRSHKG